MLALLGGLVGIALGAIGVGLLVPMITDAVPSLMLDKIALSRPVLLFTLLATVGAGLLFGSNDRLSAADWLSPEEVRSVTCESAPICCR